MPIFSFIGHTLPEFLKKSWQIYEQTNETFYTSNDVHLQNNMLRRKTILAVHRSTNRRCSMKQGVLKISQNSQENNCARVSFFDKVAISRPFFSIFKNTIFTEHLCTTASMCSCQKSKKF